MTRSMRYEDALRLNVHVRVSSLDPCFCWQVTHFALSIPSTAKFFMSLLTLKALAPSASLVSGAVQSVVYLLKTRGGLANSPMAQFDSWKPREDILVRPLCLRSLQTC